jgi:hypothetical protein
VTQFCALSRKQPPFTLRDARIDESNYWMLIMANGWTDERRARQAELIRGWAPWEKSTGPKTPEGIAVSSRNAHRVTIRKCLKFAIWLGREQDRYLAGKPWAGFEAARRMAKWALLEDWDC